MTDETAWKNLAAPVPDGRPGVIYRKNDAILDDALKNLGLAGAVTLGGSLAALATSSKAHRLAAICVGAAGLLWTVVSYVGARTLLRPARGAIANTVGRVATVPESTVTTNDLRGIDKDGWPFSCRRVQLNGATFIDVQTARSNTCLAIVDGRGEVLPSVTLDWM